VTTTDLVTARPAALKDLPRTEALATAEQEAVRDDRGGRLHLDHDTLDVTIAEAHAQALDDDSQALVVGCIDGEVVGFARAGLSPTRTSQLCMIEELIVHPDARAIGVGSEILAVVRSWAVDQGCESIESQVLPGNRAAKNFFERVGMKTRKMRVSADL